MTATRTILVAHRSAATRGAFASALAEARHHAVEADTEAAALEAMTAGPDRPHLALIDLGLAADGEAFVRALRARGGDGVALMVFAGTVPSADVIPALANLHVTYVNEHAATPQILPALAPHLFPDSFNRRAGPRVRLGVPISYRIGQTAAGATTLDVGQGGAALRTLTPAAPGTMLRVRFRLPATTMDVEAAARVIWSDPRVGMGVQFEDLAPAAQAALDALVDRECGPPAA